MNAVGGNKVYSVPSQAGAAEKTCHLEKPARRVARIANPIFKMLGLGVLFAAISVLSAYSILNPIVVVEITRLVFLCMIALILQRDSNSTDLYTNTVVASVLDAEIV